MTFNLLSPTLQRKIWDMEWRRFTPIQEAAIPVLLRKQHALLLAGTASGKTEAAFLPVLSHLEHAGPIQQVKVLYLSPLRALINDQFERIERLVDTLHIPLIKWHGDVSRAKKLAWLDDPKGILQITPESLESLLINRIEQAAQMLQHVEYVIVDELHAFLEGDRGLHVQSLLWRMRRYMQHDPVMIGLSATIGDTSVAQHFLWPDDPAQVEVVNPGDGKRQIFLTVEYFAKEKGTFPPALVRDAYDLTKDQKAILFCNSRGQVEELTHQLNETGRQLGGPLYTPRWHAHHSSVEKADREWIEAQMKESPLPLSVVCTNTLELGIDIGALDLVVQVDATHSVSSLKQRLGRSGRREGTDATLMMYATADEDLVQAVAVTELLFDKWLEPPALRRETWDLLFHQALALCTERQGIVLDDLVTEIARHPLFAALPHARVKELLTWMHEYDWLTVVEGRSILGLQGERLVRSRDFYAVFQSPQLYKVQHGARLVGTIEASPLVVPGETILLAGGTWEITDLDERKGLVYVTPSPQGKKPVWLSGSRHVHPMIAARIYDVYTGDADYDYLSPRAWHRLQEARFLAKSYGWASGFRILQVDARSLTLYDFAGTRRQNALATLIRGWLRDQDLPLQVRQSAFAVTLEGSASHFDDTLPKRLLTFLIDTLGRRQETRFLFMGRAAELEAKPPTKYAAYLPKHFQRLIEDELERDVEGLRHWIQEQTWRIKKENAPS